MFGKRKSSAQGKTEEPTIDASATGKTAKKRSSKPDVSAVLDRAPTPPVREPVRRPSDYVTNARRGNTQRGDSEGKKLTVGPGILLSGDITACEKLLVEGDVQANLADAHTLEIVEGGIFKGTAQVDYAEVSGRYEGDLVVRKQLTLHKTGLVTGKITVYDLEIHKGGRLLGEISEYTSNPAEQQVCNAPHSSMPDPGLKDTDASTPLSNTGLEETGNDSFKL